MRVLNWLRELFSVGPTGDPVPPRPPGIRKPLIPLDQYRTTPKKRFAKTPGRPSGVACKCGSELCHVLGGSAILIGIEEHLFCRACDREVWIAPRGDTIIGGYTVAGTPKNPKPPVWPART